MSFLVALFGNIPTELYDKAILRHQNILKFKSTDCIIIGSGIPQTFAYEDYADGQIVICGIPLVKSDNKYKEVRKNELYDLFKNPKKAEQFEGHFTSLIKKNSRLTIFNDKLGFREFYEYAGENYSIITTEVRFISELLGGLKLSKNWMATGYSLNLQLDKECFADGINRYCGSEVLELSYSDGKLTRKNSKLEIPNNPPIDEKAIIDEILRLAFPEIEGFDPVLSMSGGLDSRFLLSIIKPKFPDIKAISIGLPEHPDNIFAAKVCKSIGVEHKVFNCMDFGSYPATFHDFIGYVEKNKAHSPTSEYLFMRLCDYIYNDRKIQIDGGLGEIGRFSFFTSIYYRAKYGIKKIDNQTLYGLLKSHRPKVFKTEFENELLKIGLKKADYIIERYQLNNPKTLQRQLDNLSMDYKISNNVSGKQTYNDYTALCLSPFNQHIIYRAFIEFDPKLKHNSKLYRRKIAENFPTLTKINLVKNTHVIPYQFSTLAARLFMKLTKSRYSGNYAVKFFEIFADEIRDYLNCRQTSEFEYYDKNKLHKIIDQANPTDQKSCENIDSLLTLEIFRRSVERS